MIFPRDYKPSGFPYHFGGALGGLLFAYLLHKGTDLTRYINNVIDFCMNPSIFKPNPGKPKMKVNYGSKAQKSADTTTKKQQKAEEPKSQDVSQQERINKIREKIKQSGYQGLTEEEKRELFNASIR